jgi:DNA invertase Pin-like site-specific DNA recombinase
MSEAVTVSASHLRRAAVVYVRQSSATQLRRNRESADRQYALVERATRLGWPRSAVRIIDADLGVSGSGAVPRDGFAELTAEVALGRVGIILALEVSRLARNNADWYQLLDLAGMTDTLLADADGLYHPGLFNDRLVLGLKGTMSEAELHVLRARLDGGIRNKAARGELRRALPVGLVWGEEPGEVRLHPDAQVTGVIAAIFERFAACGSARATWLWLREQGLSFPLQRVGDPDITWVAPSYHAVHKVLTHPAYAGAYVYGKTRHERYVDEHGVLRTRRRKLARTDWEVLLPQHHPGFIDWDTYQANQARLGANTRPKAHADGEGAVREGSALLQGLAVCGNCGRKLGVHYRGRKRSTPGYHCNAGVLVAGKGHRCLSVGGVQIDQAVAHAFLAELAPAGSRPPWPRRPRWKPSTTPRSGSAGVRWNAPATRQPRPSGGTGRSIRTTGWSLVAWKPSGSRHLAHSPTPKPNWPAARPASRSPSPEPNRRRCSPSATTSNACGRRRPPPTGTARNCCAPCSRKSSCVSTGMPPAPSSRCAGAEDS